MKMRENFVWMKNRRFFGALVSSLSCFFLPKTLSYRAVLFQDNFDKQTKGVMHDSAEIKIIFLIILFLIQTPVMAAISLPYSETFDNYPSGSISNKQVGDWAGSIGTCSGKQTTTITPDAAYGGTGKGIRYWVGNAKNDNSGPIYTSFNNDINEIWIRFYKRYQSGFTWANQLEEKVIWLDDATIGSALVFENSRYICWGDGANRTDAIYFWNQNSGSGNICGPANTGWIATQRGSTGDGQWHVYEVHFKKQSSTNSYDGIEEVWIDGVLKMSRTDLNLGAEWPKKLIQLQVNQEAGGNVGCRYIDLDNISMSTTGYIGPIGVGDTTPPTGSITAPSNGETLSGSRILSAIASDNVGVAGVQFKVDGNNIGAEVNSSPYSYSWDSSSVSNGTHILTVTAKDTAGNTTASSPVTVTVSNTATAAPTVSLTVNPASIAPSQSSTLIWSSTNATSCTASGGWAGTKTTSGNQPVSPTSTTNYTLSCTGTGGTAQQTTTVTVASSTPAPTVSLAANPATITLGQSSTLSWSSTNATSCTASGSWSGTKSQSGTESVSPTTTSTYILTCTGTGGKTNQSATVSVTGGTRTVFFTENFDDANFAARSWYDVTTGTIDTANKYEGTGSLQCSFAIGGTGCQGNAPRRRKFTPSDSVYISYWTRMSSNWVGSGLAYHPHLIFLLTNLNGDYDGYYGTNLTAYLEQVDKTMLMGIQDARLIYGGSNPAQPPNPVAGENKGLAGCNGLFDGSAHPNTAQDCYWGGTMWLNGRWYRASAPSFSTSCPGPTCLTDWHHVEAYFKMNTITAGVSNADGILKLSVDGAVLYNYTDIRFRTGYGTNATKQFNQFGLSPYIGDGSPVAQTIWFDNLVVASEPPSSSTILSAPTNLRISP